MEVTSRRHLPNETRVKLNFLPQKLLKRLLPFQVDGVIFGIEREGRCLIADEMGLGKTLQALAIAYYYKNEWPMLIIVPASLKYNWIEEIEKWFPHIGPTEINLIESGSDVGNLTTSLISVVTYGLLRAPTSKVLKEALANARFKMVIADESHYIKNRKAAGTQFIVPLLKKADRKLLLTGTPALARPAELFPQLESINDKIFNNWTSFAYRYCDAGWQYYGRNKRWRADGGSNLDELQTKLVKHIMIRRLKRNVLTQLPPKRRQKIPFELKDSNNKKELNEIWSNLRQALGHNNITINEALDGNIKNEQGTSAKGESSSLEVYKLMSQLHHHTADIKTGPVCEYLNMMIDDVGLKMLIFAYHHSMMDSLQKTLMDKNVKHIRIDGKTPTAERPELVRSFQTDSNIRVAILSTKAAGVGLTLTAANLVIFAELDWTPGALEQCEDRAHRIGQKNTVHIHYLVAKGTLDDWVWTAIARKTAIVSTTLNGETETLQMDLGTESQINVLSSADTEKFDYNQEMDDMTFFNTQKPSIQKSVLDFFSPSQTKESSTPDQSAPTVKGKVRGKKRKKVLQYEDSSDGDSECLQVIKTKKSENSLEKPSCTAGQILKSVSAVDQWECTRCTFLNHDLMTLCEMCANPKQEGTTQESNTESSQHSIDAPLIIVDDTAENRTGDFHSLDSCHACSEDGNCVPAINNLEHNSETLTSKSPEDMKSLPVSKRTKFKFKHTLTSTRRLLSTASPDPKPPSESQEIRDNDTMEEEKAASHLLFSPGHKERTDGDPWVCPCGYENESRNDLCDGCLEELPRPEPTKVERRVINLDHVKKYELLKFCCSENTSRVFLYDENGTPLNINFIPLDVEMGNFTELPDILLHPHNLKFVRRFVREWNSLTPTKQRVVIRSKGIFSSPQLQYDEIKSNKNASNQRYTSKADTAAAATMKAHEIHGSVRQISRPSSKKIKEVKIPEAASLGESARSQETYDSNYQDAMPGILQALDAEGRPLCVECQNPYKTSLVSEKTLEENPWCTRFCSKSCADQYWMSNHRDYGAKLVNEIEHGICQLCKFDAKDFFDRIRLTLDLKERSNLIKDSHYNQLKSEAKEKMVKEPKRGLFWHIDHVTPVADGGGQCGIDNLRTLCVVCHRKVTAQQNKDRAARKKKEMGVRSGNITQFLRKT